MRYSLGHILSKIEVQESFHLYKLHIGCCDVGLIPWSWLAWLQAREEASLSTHFEQPSRKTADHLQAALHHEHVATLRQGHL